MLRDHCEIISLDSVDRDGWLQLRTKGIGGSDVGAIVGVSKYASPYSLFCEKTGLVVPDNDAGEAAAWGNRLEGAVAGAFAEETGMAIVEWNVMLRSHQRPHALANVDRWIVTPSEQFPAGTVSMWYGADEPIGITGILECKTSAIATHGTNHLWDDDKIPDGYLLQTVHYGIVTGVHDIYFGALLGGQGFVTRHLEWDEDLAENIVCIEDEFWNRILTGNAPDVDGSEATENAIAARYPSSVEGTTVDGGAALLAAWEELEQAKDYFKQAEADKKLARSKVVAILGEAEYGTADGVPLCSFKSGKDQEYFATEVFKAAHPDLYKEFTRTKPGFRTLRSKK